MGNTARAKDVVDVWRYFAISGGRYVTPREELEDDGSWGGY
jgi:hypothetical protein